MGSDSLNYTASIKHAWRQWYLNGYIIKGYVYDDTKRRGFQDGSFLLTSAVTSETCMDGYVAVRTLNSVYKVYFREGESEIPIRPEQPE